MSEGAACGLPGPRVTRPVSEWLRANDISPRDMPDDAEIRIDETAATIIVERFYLNDDGRPTIHGQYPLTRLVTVPLLAPPPPGLLDAYRHTIGKLRAERSAAEAIRRETADRIVERILTDVAARR